jgi:enamine deaminase RidA (YjgF/YER057c/UK114 family)
MNAIYTTYFKEPRPARTTVGVANLVGTARIEVTVTAHR